jgi:hypothetical protein
MKPMDLRLLLTSLEAIEHICTQEKAKTESSEKASHKGKNGKKQPGTKATARVPKKDCTYERHATCARSMGACTLCTISGIAISMIGTEWRSPISVPPRKVERKPNPARQNFAQLSKKLDKIRRLLTSQARNPRNTNARIAIPTLNRELGRVALVK